MVLSEPEYVRLIDDINEQDLCGRMFSKEKVFTVGDILDIPFSEANTALQNFINRRPDIILLDESSKVYYGHVDNLGYFICEDEIV